MVPCWYKNVTRYYLPLACFSVYLPCCFLVTKGNYNLSRRSKVCASKHEFGKSKYSTSPISKSVRSKMSLIFEAVVCLKFLKRVLYFIILVHRTVFSAPLLVSRILDFPMNLSQKWSLGPSSWITFLRKLFDPYYLFSIFVDHT